MKFGSWICIFLCAALCSGLVHGQEEAGGEEVPAGDPAAEAAALRDLQTTLEKLAADGTEHPRDREYALQALARVRRALGSWGESAAYYDGLLSQWLPDQLAGPVVSGAVTARKSKDGAIQAALEFFKKEGAEFAKHSGAVAQAMQRSQQHIEKASKSLESGAKERDLKLKPLPGVRAKDPGDPLWVIPEPAWLAPPPAPKKAPPPDAPLPGANQLPWNRPPGLQALGPAMVKLVEGIGEVKK
ncbi:MAG: hypothetical protein AMXMBFR7_07750 [Planctomycetota bacterium]